MESRITLPWLKLHKILIVLIILLLACSCKTDPTYFVERAAVEEGIFDESDRVSITYSNKALFGDLIFYELCDEITEPSQCAFVVDCAGKLFTFYSFGQAPHKGSEQSTISNHYLRMAKQFFEITQCNNLNLTYENIHQYIDIFTEIVGFKSKRLLNVDEITSLPPYLMPKLEMYEKDINAPVIDIQENQIALKFYSWRYRGYILKWDLLLERNGKCISCNVENILDLRFR